MLESAVFDISIVLFCAQESQNHGKCKFKDFRRSVLRTGVPEILKVHFLRVPTSCSVHRSPRIPGSAFFEISDVLFSVQESQNS